MLLVMILKENWCKQSGVKATKTSGITIDKVVDELWNEARYNATRPASDGFESLIDKFGIKRDFGGNGYIPDTEEETRQVLYRVQSQLNDIEVILKRHVDDFEDVDDFERLWYNFNKDKDMAEQYIRFLRTHLEYFDLANRLPSYWF